MRLQTLLDKRGFSLVEVMVVVAIIGILATIVIPRGSRRTELGAALEGDARMLAQNLRLAREKAMTEGAKIGIRFTQPDQYQIMNLTTNTPIKKGIALSREISGPTVATISFNTDGTLNVATTTTLKTVDGRKRNVTVNKLGVVTVGPVQK